MTDKRRCERFERSGRSRLRSGAFALLGLATILACATSLESLGATRAVATTPDDPKALGVVAEASAPEAMDGTITVITVKVPVPLQGKPVTGEFEGMELPFFKDSPDGSVYRAVLGVPYDHKPGPTSVKVKVGDSAETSALFIVEPGDYDSETLKVDGRRVQPQKPKDLARIRREQAEIGEVYRTVTPRKYWSGPFSLPLDAKFTSKFGTKRVYNGIQKSAHLGLDFKAAVGTPIHAPAPGKVVMAKNLFFTGNTVILDHGYGVLSLYAHLDKLKVRKGVEVKTGKVLGLSGMTGRVTGPHLHWMAIIHKQKVNPFGFTQVMK